MACECLLGQVGRLLMFALLAGGCICGFYAAISCEFFSYEDSTDANALPMPYKNQTSASVGIFGSLNEGNDCKTYQKNFMDATDEFNTYWITAQFSAIVGPGTCSQHFVPTICRSGICCGVLWCAVLCCAWFPSPVWNVSITWLTTLHYYHK